MLIQSEEVERITLIELTVPWKDGCQEASQRKAANYQDLQGPTMQGQTQSVGSFQVKSVQRYFTALGLAGRERNTAVQRLGETAEGASRWLWNR